MLERKYRIVSKSVMTAVVVGVMSAVGSVALAAASRAPATTSPLVTATAATSATFGARSEGAASAGPPSPDYTLDLTEMTIEADAVGVVLSAVGDAALNFKSVPGQGFVVDPTNALPSSPTLAQVESLYNSQPARSLSGVNPTIEAREFSLAGVRLPAVRTLIIANDSSRVPSYQVLKITFSGPSTGKPRA